MLQQELNGVMMYEGCLRGGSVEDAVDGADEGGPRLVREYDDH
jgi:hypothetical protein